MFYLNKNKRMYEISFLILNLIDVIVNIFDPTNVNNSKIL